MVAACSSTSIIGSIVEECVGLAWWWVLGISVWILSVKCTCTRHTFMHVINLLTFKIERVMGDLLKYARCIFTGVCGYHYLINGTMSDVIISITVMSAYVNLCICAYGHQ